MCGISAMLGSSLISIDDFFQSLQKLKNRGYDSAGVSFLHQNQFFFEKELTHQALDRLFLKLEKIQTFNIMGHTRWATHGNVSILNCHPHVDTIECHYAIVHNGILENYLQLL